MARHLLRTKQSHVPITQEIMIFHRNDRQQLPKSRFLTRDRSPPSIPACDMDVFLPIQLLRADKCPAYSPRE